VNLDDPRVRRTRAAALKAAGELLLTRGWEHVTHANVARASGYAKATLYKHWPEVSGLLLAAFQQVVRFEHGDLSGDLRADLVAELDVFRRALTDDGLGNWLPAMADRASNDPQIAELRRYFLDEGQARLLSLIRQGVERGELRAVDDVQPVADMLSGSVAYRVALNGQPVEQAFLESVVDTFLRGMAPRK